MATLLAFDKEAEARANSRASGKKQRKPMTEQQKLNRDLAMLNKFERSRAG